MKSTTYILLLGILGLLSSCANKAKTVKTATDETITSTTNNKVKQMTSIYELAINKAKSGQYQQFLESRAKFVDVLGKQEATLNEGKWQPFFTVGDMKLDDVLVGMTHWNSMEGFGATAAKLLPQQEAKDYFVTFDPLAYVLLETKDGKPFDMERIKKKGQVVEFAIRTGKTADAFGEKRETFFKSLDKYDGYNFAREFKVYQLDDNSMPAFQENTQAVIIVWDSAEQFQAAAQPIFQTAEYQNFAKELNVSAYFATAPIVE